LFTSFNDEFGNRDLDSITPDEILSFLTRLTEGTRHLCAVKSDLTGAIKDTDIHFFGMKIDAAIVLVLIGVKIHLASSFLYGLGFWRKPILPCFRRRP